MTSRFWKKRKNSQPIILTFIYVADRELLLAAVKKSGGARHYVAKSLKAVKYFCVDELDGLKVPNIIIKIPCYHRQINTTSTLKKIVP